MLSEAARAIRPGLPYGGALFRVAGDGVVVEATSETPEYTATGRGMSDLRAGVTIPASGTAIEQVLSYGLGTHSWDDMQAAFATPRIRTAGWRSGIATAFESGGSTYLLWFASVTTTGTWTPEDHAYVEVIASFFASQAQLRWQYDQIHYHQTHDVLTGIFNRSQFRSQSRSAALDAERYAVIVINVDGFGEINAAYGSMIGDAVLVEVAAGICDRAAAFAERFRTPFSTGDREGRDFIARTASIGVAIAPEHGDTVDVVIARANAAVGAAKARGRNTVVAFEAGMEAAVQ